MKKSFAFCFLLMIFSSCFAKEKFINYAFGISTGIPVYDSSQIKQINKYFYNNGTRIILGTNARVEFNILQIQIYYLILILILKNILIC